MKVVGELFGSGQMQLPFVLQSAETMKFAVSVLEPHMETVDEKISNGKLLIATVKGDVHDIGKNLVDIILSNNGFDVINLGIKQDVSAIIDAQKKHKADCIAMSGLLVKSTAFMKDNLEAFNNAEINVPVILGGAALTPKFVNEDCSQIYKGKILYGKDAFTDLQFMNDYMDSKKKGNWSNENGFTNTDDTQIKLASPRSSAKDKDLNKNFEKTKSIQLIENFNRSNFVEEEEPIKAPFLGTRVLQDIEIDFDKLIFYLDKKALFSGQWQIKKNKPTKPIYIRPFVYTSDLGIAPRLHNIETDFFIYCIELGDYLSPDGVSCRMSSWTRQEDRSLPLRGKISGAYITSSLAKTEASLSGFDEALLLNSSGKVSEASGMNLFIVRNGELITPGVDQDILEGITRASVIEMAKSFGINVIERPVDKTELLIADEVFLTGTAAKITPVKQIESTNINNDRPIMKKLKNKLIEITEGRSQDYDDWITRIDIS